MEKHIQFFRRIKYYKNKSIVFSTNLTVGKPIWVWFDIIVELTNLGLALTFNQTFPVFGVFGESASCTSSKKQTKIRIQNTKFIIPL